MDLTEILPSERVVEILHPGTEEPIGVRVTLMSITDERLKKLKRKFQDERLRLEARGKNFKSDELEENRDELAFKAMTSWDWYGDATFNGKKPEFNQANVLAVLQKLVWFRDQIEAEIGDEKSFFSPSKRG